KLVTGVQTCALPIYCPSIDADFTGIERLRTTTSLPDFLHVGHDFQSRVVPNLNLRFVNRVQRWDSAANDHRFDTQRGACPHDIGARGGETREGSRIER